MNRLRTALGFAAGAMMLASAAAHSLLGWPELRSALTKAQVSPDLVSSLGFGWNFGGVAMLAMGLIAFLHFVERVRGGKVSRTPVRVIASAYVAFGGVAILMTGDLFFLVFVIPGVLLGAASWAP